MFEVAHSCAEHCDAALICLLYRILVTNASSWLNDCLYAIFSSKGHSVIEWEESVRSENESLCLDVLASFCKSCLSLLKSDLCRTDTVHLTGAYSESSAVLYNYEKGAYSTITFKWNDRSKKLTIGAIAGEYPGMLKDRSFRVRLAGTDTHVNVDYTGKSLTVSL